MIREIFTIRRTSKKFDNFKKFQSILEYSEKITKWIFRANKRINEMKSKISFFVAPMSESVHSVKEEANVKLRKLFDSKEFWRQ